LGKFRKDEGKKKEGCSHQSDQLGGNDAGVPKDGNRGQENGKTTPKPGVLRGGEMKRRGKSRSPVGGPGTVKGSSWRIETNQTP